jgi:hypothetical protein
MFWVLWGTQDCEGTKRVLWGYWFARVLRRYWYWFARALGCEGTMRVLRFARVLCVY